MGLNNESRSWGHSLVRIILQGTLRKSITNLPSFFITAVVVAFSLNVVLARARLLMCTSRATKTQKGPSMVSPEP